eukprot:NODE_5492_length_573_cov_44.643130_g4028_i1.p4 GENE.NODE_5492_length_573_cov_44.643130_g4028_i1~~NODE_5492_length_573_cov_44.643130_g4028_i1.p4  ORF type:complete len:78 (-),score=24.35 NODE_5492_length_573_cov_44.643130_g4028_i1:91-324(-)
MNPEQQLNSWCAREGLQPRMVLSHEVSMDGSVSGSMSVVSQGMEYTVESHQGTLSELRNDLSSQLFQLVSSTASYRQ